MNALRLIAVFTVLMLLLIVRFWVVNHNKSNYINGQEVSFHTTISTTPKIVGRNQYLTVKEQNGGSITLIIPLFIEANYGETVRVSGKIENKVLNKKRIISTIYLPKIEAVKNRENVILKSPLAIIDSLRQNLISFFNKMLPPISASLLLGIVFGIKEQMPKNFSDALRTTGVMHVIAASGMNVVMVGGFLTSIFTYFFKRRLALLLSIIGIFFYAALAGFEPSIARASIMGSIALSAQILGRQRLAAYSLFLTAYLMLFISPELISNIGFQLSFLSTLGLLYIKPLFENGKLNTLVQRTIGLWPKKSIIGEDLTTTISAQIATAPILIINFGTYSFWSILVNVLVLWTIPILMILGGVGAIVGLIFPFVGQIFLYLSLPFLLYFEKIVMLFSQFGSINIQAFPWQFLVSFYCLLLIIIIYFTRNKTKHA